VRFAFGLTLPFLGGISEAEQRFFSDFRALLLEAELLLIFRGTSSGEVCFLVE
jgi:hypothetical protein